MTDTAALRALLAAARSSGDHIVLTNALGGLTLTGEIEALLDEVEALRAALTMLTAAASDTDRNMREADGHCLDCGRPADIPHDDPDCGMAGLAVWARAARAALKEGKA